MIQWMKKRLQLILLMVFFGLGLLLVVMIHFKPGLKYYAYAPYSFYILQPDEVSAEVIPEYAGIRQTYSFTIPEGSATTIGARISFYLHHTVAEVSMEGSTLVYDSGETEEPHIGHTPGNYWVTIPVRPNYAGKTVRVSLTPVFPGVRNETPVFYLIGHEQLLTMLLLPQDALMLFLCFLSLLSGFVLFLFAALLRLKHEDRKHIVLIGAITIAACLWKLSGLSSVALMLDSYGWHKQIWYFGAVMYLATLLLSLLFMNNIQPENTGKAGVICYHIALISSVILLLLQLGNRIELHDVLIWYGIGAAMLHLIALFEHRPSRQKLLWGLPFLLTLGLDLLFLAFRSSMHNAPFFLLWVIFILFIQGFGFVRNAIQREKTLQEQERELQDAKITSMMQQIRPHFIYNTLSSVYVLCRDNPPLAMKVIQDFTAYLQANFTAISSTAPITFLDELQHTKSYLAVEQIRYGERLKVEFDTQHTAFRLPALTLQPLVENAVKHSIGKGSTPSTVLVRSYYQDGFSIITVEDNGPGFDSAAESNPSEHIGLKNVEERLRMMCNGTLEIRSSPGHGTIVTVSLPDDTIRSGSLPSDGSAPALHGY